MPGLLVAALLTVACFGQMDPGLHVISSSRHAACVLKTTECGLGSSIECWGHSDITNDVPAGNDFLSVVVGYQSACALRVTGSVTCWGRERMYYGAGVVATTPTDTDFVQIGAFKGWNVCGVKASGEIKCWGQTGSYNIIRDQPSGAEFTAVTCGSHACCAIDTDKKLQCFGYMRFLPGLRSLDQTDYSFVGITIAHTDACALQENGEVICWGQYGTPSYLHGSYWSPNDWMTHSDYQRVAIGQWDSCAIRGASRTLYCFGHHNKHILHYLPDEEINDVVAISGQEWFECIVTADGHVRCWGLTNDGRTANVVEDAPTDGGVTIPSDNSCVVQAITQCSAGGATRASLSARGKEQALADIPWMHEKSVGESSGSIQSEELDAELKRDREMQIAEENDRLKKAHEALLESLLELEA